MGLYRGFIFPSIANPYVYLTSLTTSSNPEAQLIGYSAANLLSSFEGKLQNEHIKTGLNFLLQVATTQKNHEINFIQERINRLARSGDGQLQKDLIEQLNKIKDPESFNYLDFISLLNSAMQNTEQYKARLNKLKSAPGKNKNNTYDVEAQRNLINSLQSTIGAFTKQRTEFFYSQEELIRQLTIQFFNTSVGQNFISQLVGKNGALLFSAAVSIIQTQLAKYLYDNMLLTYSKSYYPDEQHFLDELNRLSAHFDDFIKRTNVDHVLSNHDVLYEAAQLFGLNINLKEKTPSSTKEAKIAHQRLRSLQQQIGDPLASQKRAFKDALKGVRVQWSDNNKISLMQELQTLISSELGGSHMGRFQTGTDVLLGQFVASTPSATATRDPVLEAVKKIKLDMQTRHAANKVDAMSDIYLKQLDALNEDLQDIGKGFILHETTKFYQTLEKGYWYNNKKGFSGREMSLLNYIDAIGQFGKSFGINTNWLKFAAYNLSPNALGSGLKAPLESYFAIMAGLIMFDDFAVIAQEVTEGLQYSNVEAVHLYSLQGIYLPASYFLQETYNRMQDIEQQLTTGNAFTAKITAPSVKYSRSVAPTMAERWEVLKGSASKVSISLTFAANFLALVNQLF